jgi:arginase
MPVSFLLGLGGKIPEFAWIKSILKPEHLVYIGLRDLDADEKNILREYKIKAFSMHEIDRYGIGKVMEMALDHITPKRDLPIHLSFDVDALDPSVAPSTGTPVSHPYSATLLAEQKLRPIGSWRAYIQRGSLYMRSHSRDGTARCPRSNGTPCNCSHCSDRDSASQEVNPSLAGEVSGNQTVAVGCSLVRAALGQRLVIYLVPQAHPSFQGRPCCDQPFAFSNGLCRFVSWNYPSLRS